MVDLGERLTALLQVLVACVDVGLHREGRVIVTRHLLMIEMGTPAFSSRLSVVCRESCRRILGSPARLSMRVNSSE